MKQVPRLPALEGLRGVAAAMVFLVHYTSPINPWLTGTASPVAEALGAWGNRGVDLFFALSGYLIYASLIRRKQAIGTYARRRAMRLYPAFLAVLAVYLVLGAALPGSINMPPGWLDSAAYLGANLLLLPGLFPITPIIGVAWSLSYEAAFYVVLPPFIGLLALRRWPPLARAALILAIPVALQLLTGAAPPRASLFACGMLLAEAGPLLARHAARLGVLALLAVPVCAVLLLGAGPEPMERTLAFWAVFATSFALCGAAIGGRGIVAAALGLRPLRWLGTISYSFYLVHGLMLHGFFMAAARLQVPGALGWVMLVPAFLVSLGGSIALFWLVERRFSLEPVRPAATPAASPPHSPSPLRSPSFP